MPKGREKKVADAKISEVEALKEFLGDLEPTLEAVVRMSVSGEELLSEHGTPTESDLSIVCN